MSINSRFYTLRSSLLISLVVKFAIFIVGIAIMGLLSSRTGLTACGASGGSNPQVYVSPYGDLEAYTDFRDLYLRCLVTPFLGGKAAYSLPIVYNYPPLFLYTISIFALVNYVWFSAIPLVLFDALTVIPVYLIAKNFVFHGNEKQAFAVSLIWIFNPMNLFYNDLMWLNPGPTTFFLLLSLLLFLRKDWTFSAIALAVSTGFKQISVLLMPVFLVVLWKTAGFSKKLIYFLASYVGFLVLFSTPYLFQNPQGYFWSLGLPLLGNPPGAGPNYPSTFIYDLSQPTRLTTFLGLIKFVNLQSLAVASYPYLNYVFIAAFALILLNLSLKRSSITREQVLVYSLIALSLFTALFGRGVYKYYFTSLTPIGALVFSSKKGAIIFELFCVSLMLLPREVTPWFAILLVTLIPSFGFKKGDPLVEQKTKIDETPSVSSPLPQPENSNSPIQSELSELVS